VPRPLHHAHRTGVVRVPATAAWLAGAALFASVLAPARTRAQPPPSAPVEQPPATPEVHAAALGLVLPRGDGGGGALAMGLELPLARGRVAVGGSFGAGILASDDAQKERSLAFLGPSVAFRFPIGDRMLLAIRGRAGGHLGVLEEEGVLGGLFVSGGAWWTIAVDPSLHLGLGMEVWGVLLGGSGDDLVVYAPGVIARFGLRDGALPVVGGSS